MKRDMDLVRKILFALEEQEAMTGRNPVIPDFTEEQIAYHASIMLQAELVTGYAITDLEAANPEAIATGLTWEGHEFLDLSRSETLWAKAKVKTVAAAGGLGLVTLKAALTELVKQAMA